MKTTIHLASIGFVLTVMSNVSWAVVLVSENFDGYADQAAFEAAWIPNGTVAPISATLATDQASSPSKSIRVDGTTTTGQQRNQRSFSETSTIGTIADGYSIIFSFDFYDSNAAAAPYRQHSFLQDGATPTGTGQSIGMGLNNNQLLSASGGNFYMARILGYTPTTIDPDGGPNEGGTLTSGGFFKLNDYNNTLTLRTTGWNNLKVVINSDDGLSADFEFFVNDTLAERVSNVGTAAQFRSYETIRLGSALSNASSAAWYDNFSVQVVIPEPSTIGLSLVGALAFAWRRRRH
jgi:PEP-CTERM motif